MQRRELAFAELGIAVVPDAAELAIDLGVGARSRGPADELDREITLALTELECDGTGATLKSMGVVAPNGKRNGKALAEPSPSAS